MALSEQRVEAGLSKANMQTGQRSPIQLLSVSVPSVRILGQEMRPEGRMAFQLGANSLNHAVDLLLENQQVCPSVETIIFVTEDGRLVHFTDSGPVQMPQALHEPQN